MNPKLAVKGINGIIEGGISVTDFSVVTELDEISAKELLYTLVHKPLLTVDDPVIAISGCGAQKLSGISTRLGLCHRVAGGDFCIEQGL